MDLNNLTREEAVKLVGEDLVKQVDSEDCEYSSYDELNKTQEWTAHTEVDDDNSEYRLLTTHYFVTDEEISAVENLDDVDWKINHYSLID